MLIIYRKVKIRLYKGLGVTISLKNTIYKMKECGSTKNDAFIVVITETGLKS